MSPCDPWEDARSAAAYIAALVDGEGCVGAYEWRGRSGRTARRRTIVVSVRDKEIIDAAERCYRTLGIHCSRSSRYLANRGYRMWTIDVSTYVGAARFAAVIALQHREKAAKLAVVLAAFRPQVCAACGCTWDARTVGCANCRDRHKARRRSEREGAGTRPSVPGRTGRPRRARAAPEVA